MSWTSLRLGKSLGPVKLSRCWTDGGLKGMDDPLALLRLFHVYLRIGG